MTIDEAIKHTKRVLYEHSIAMSPEQIAAVELGIEALKNYQSMKRTGEIWEGFRLPEEEEE